MASSIHVSNEGLSIQNENSKILLDPSKIDNNNFVFVSHAHSDHVYKKPKNKTKIKTLISKETELIACVRGYEITNPVYEEKNYELIDTGHILGSRGLLAFNDVYYTGDISIRKRGFMKSQNKIPKVDKLIIESTFGKPEYTFPDPKEVVHKTNEIISKAYENGIPVIIMGYSLGKAQLLVDLFSHWDPFYVSDSIENINMIYRKMKIQLRDVITYSQAEKNHSLSKKPWIMLSSLMNGRSNFLKSIKEKYNAITIGFSGWACNPGYKYMMALDHAMPLSDHCDYNELLEVVENSDPKKVYTLHGFAEDFAKTLLELGYDAEPITNGYKKKINGNDGEESNKYLKLKDNTKNRVLDSFIE
ncbi:MAG: exonuclease [Nitrososphaeraceae archaeon]